MLSKYTYPVPSLKLISKFVRRLFTYWVEQLKINENMDSIGEKLSFSFLSAVLEKRTQDDCIVLVIMKFGLINKAN